LDYLLLLSFDLRNYFENVTRISSALYPISSEENLAATLNQVSAVEKWISLGAKTSQIVLGIPSYGRSFELSNKSIDSVGAPISGKINEQ
jgi:chitinase